jgi:hypothetical protein
MNLRFAIRSVCLMALVIASISFPALSRAADSDRPQYYQIRVYSTKSADQQQRINDY